MKKEKLTYAEMLKDPRWQKKRLEVMQRDGFRCQHCLREDKELQVHHLLYRKGAKPWEYKNEELVTLCKRCHEFEGDAKKETYEIFNELKNTFAEEGYSRELLNSLLSKLTQVAKSGTMDVDFDDKSAVDFLKEGIYGVQYFSDILSASRHRVDVRDLVEHNFHNMLEKYDKEVEYGEAD